MVSKFTPGPWFVTTDVTATGPVVQAADGAHVAVCAPVTIYAGNVCVQTTQEHAANNALLIAAAPDLLAALQAIVEEAGPQYGFAEADGAVIGTINRLSYLARAAIAKATGEQS